MLPSSHRLRRKEVIEVLKRGRGLPSGKYVSVKVFYPSAKESVTIRSTVAVSKRVARTNVARNRIRRALYDAIRTITNNIQPATNNKCTHAVFFVRSIPTDSLRTAFSDDVKKILSALF